ncbi:unnamed protein product [Ambrosiozyma monospora]|uniref:Unnamed protein product n=1 Tax=Ambrosiozyma monospora TaxID=43982 RepID=A0ACB5SR90_AMBMO|nr:unnamed protein product [Ambrosiozyma monospora]
MGPKRFNIHKKWGAPPLPLPIVKDLVSEIHFQCIDCPDTFHSYKEVCQHLDAKKQENKEPGKHLGIEGPNMGAIACEKCHCSEIHQLHAMTVGGTMLFMYCSGCLDEAKEDYDDGDLQIIAFDDENGDLFYSRCQEFHYFREMACVRCTSTWMMNACAKSVLCDKCIKNDNSLVDQPRVSDSDDGFLATLFQDPSFGEFTAQTDTRRRRRRV